MKIDKKVKIRRQTNGWLLRSIVQPMEGKVDVEKWLMDHASKRGKSNMVQFMMEQGLPGVFFET